MTKCNRLVAAVALFAAALVMNIQAQTAWAASSKPVTVLELFTSQGCSSCPPADKLVKKFRKRDDIVALTYNVDYWDYLGWKDTLASPKYTERQRNYARARGDGQVYTPQTVINGVRHAVGNREAEIERAIGRSHRDVKKLRVPLKMWTEDGTLVIEAGAAPAGVRYKPATIWMALVKKSETVSIKRGENSGEKITYYNVVRELTPVGQWNGKAVSIRLPQHHLMARGSDGCTVFIQQDTAGPILAAAEMTDW